IEVNILVVIPLEEIPQIECAGHRKHAGKNIRMAQRYVERVVAAKAAAKRDQMRVAVLLADEWHHFVDEVIIKLHMARNAPPRRHAPVVPALVVNGIDTIKLQMAAID